MASLWAPDKQEWQWIYTKGERVQECHSTGMEGSAQTLNPKCYLEDCALHLA